MYSYAHILTHIYVYFFDSFELYCFFRGVCGYFCGGFVLALFVLYNELLGSSKRPIGAAYMAISWSTGKFVYVANLYLGNLSDI